MMNCPVDNTVLLISDRNGIEIDYCPKCRGVWLDRGELDKIVERSGAAYIDSSESSDRSGSYDEHSLKKKKKKSFLDDLFDF